MAIRTASSTGSDFSAREPVAQRLPLHDGHDEVEEAVGLAGVVERQDVRVVEGGGQVGFRGGSGSGPATPARSLAQHLDRDLAVVLEVLRQVDRGHPACAELALEAVAVGQRGGEAVWSGVLHA